MAVLAAVVALALAGCESLPQARPEAKVGAPLNNVTPRTVTLPNFRLQSGVVLKELVIAYETYGTLDSSGRNAVLIAHGNTSTFHAAGRYAPNQAPPGISGLGWWDAIIGPGKAFDTDRYFVVSSNMLGGSFGSTAPRTINPATGKPWGPDFPDITLGDMAAAQKALLDSLGVRHLVAVAGPSYGGFMAFTWATHYPDAVDGIVVVVSSPTGGKNPKAAQAIIDRLAKDPNWNGGWYYDKGGIKSAMTDLRVATLKAYGADDSLAAEYPDPTAREAAIRRMAEPWAEHFDGNSLVVQRKAMEFRDDAKDFGRVKAKVLYILCTTEKLFPPSIAPGVMARLRAAGVDATYFELVSTKGHSGGTGDAIRFDAALRDFLGRLPGKP